MKKLEICWSNQAKKSLKNIYLFIKPKSLQGAKNVKNDILNVAKQIKFAKQYQTDDINPKYRRMIVRDYKILYTASSTKIKIVDIVSCKRSSSFIKKL